MTDKPFGTHVSRHPQEININFLTKPAKEASDKIWCTYFERGTIVREYSRAFDGTTSRLQYMGLEGLTKNLTMTIALVLEQYACGKTMLEHNSFSPKIYK